MKNIRQHLHSANQYAERVEHYSADYKLNLDKFNPTQNVKRAATIQDALSVSAPAN